MSALDTLLWVAFPYASLTLLVAGLVWRWRSDQFGWTTRSSQLHEKAILRLSGLQSGPLSQNPPENTAVRSSESPVIIHQDRGLSAVRFRRDIMLVLTRKEGESIVIGNDVKITVVSVGAGRVKVGIEAPKWMAIDRQEVHDRKQVEIEEEAGVGKPAIVNRLSGQFESVDPRKTR